MCIVLYVPTLGGYFTISPFLVFVYHNMIDFHFVDFIAKRPYCMYLPRNRYHIGPDITDVCRDFFVKSLSPSTLPIQSSCTYLGVEQGSI